MDNLKKIKVWGKCTREDKCPRDVNNRRLDTTDAHRWISYDSLRLNAGEYAGFRVPPGYCVIDLDDHDGSGLNIDVLNRFLGKTYIESSMSGSGYHIVCKCQPLKGYRRRKGNVEVYQGSETARFMAYTGDLLLRDCVVVADCTMLVKWVLEKYVGKEQTHQPAPRRNTSVSADQWYNARWNRFQNSQWFAMYESGDWGRYKSQSEADLAFMHYLLFYFGDYDTVRRLFMESKMYRPEKGEQYVDRTLAAAINSWDGKYLYDYYDRG